jgi:hypothetical protein
MRILLLVIFSLFWFPLSQFPPKKKTCIPTDYTIFHTTLAVFVPFQDVSSFEEGIAPLTFKSLRVVSFPGGQQYGSINPCEMNEFSDECDAWEEANGPYKKKEYMIKSNERTKGR